MASIEKSGRISAEELSSLQAEADTCTLRGNTCNLREDLDQAEYQYLRALKINEQLFRVTREQAFLDAALENCSSLADVCMQQGNMHGADRYYVQIMKYRSLCKK